jgi:hypothetical protein
MKILRAATNLVFVTILLLRLSKQRKQLSDANLYCQFLNRKNEKLLQAMSEVNSENNRLFNSVRQYQAQLAAAKPAILRAAVTFGMKYSPLPTLLNSPVSSQCPARAAGILCWVMFRIIWCYNENNRVSRLVNHLLLKLSGSYRKKYPL